MHDELTQLKLRIAAIIEMLPDSKPGSYVDTEDMMSSARLQIKYLLLDVDATRRENKYLREMLDRQRPGGGMHQSC